jgi:hypothetical protein
VLPAVRTPRSRRFVAPMYREVAVAGGLAKSPLALPTHLVGLFRSPLLQRCAECCSWIGGDRGC